MKFTSIMALSALFICSTEAIKFNKNADPLPADHPYWDKYKKKDSDLSNTFFKASDSGTQFYERVLPAHFNGEGEFDDRFMFNLHKNYALERKTKDGKPSGKFYMDRANTLIVADEVLMNNKGMKDAAERKKWLDTYFDRSWNHFDVNNEGVIEVVQISQFMRFLASD